MVKISKIFLKRKFQNLSGNNCPQAYALSTVAEKGQNKMRIIYYIIIKFLFVKRKNKQNNKMKGKTYLI